MMISSVNKYLSKWKSRNLLLAIAVFFLATILVLVLVNVFAVASKWYFTLVGIAGLLFWRTFKNSPSHADAISYLHASYPKLQYSLRILDKDPAKLTTLESFQQEKVKEQVSTLKSKLPPAAPLLKDLGLTALLSLAMCILLMQIGNEPHIDQPQDNVAILSRTKIDLEKDSAYIDKLRTTITPPAYTGISKMTSKSLEQEVPEGSMMKWAYNINGPVKSVLFNFGDGNESTVNRHRFSKSGIYYYTVVDSAEHSFSSPYYSVKVIEDNGPTVELSGIKEYQRLPWKKNYDIAFNISIKDDYGIEDAFVSATVADGQGESVKFREKTFPLKSFGESKYSFSTKEFEMEPGSELYFYVMAKDNCPFRTQASKSATYFVVLEDTVTYDYVEDAGMQVDLMPDFFRSQRQIIIDTEKLIAEKSSISVQEFKQRSNELGFDQKMLRLKYGQFLGEEAESGIAIENEIDEEHEHDHDHDHDHEHEHEHEEGQTGKVNVLEEFGHNHDHEAESGELLAENGTRNEDPNRPEWVKAMSHNHDNVEESTYFEVSLKTKLKAALSVMWDSELHLRLYEPNKSLPFQYEALKYLEEIKNHARIYVHRIGFDPPAIKVAEKRLTGDQDKIASPTEILRINAEDKYTSIKLAVLLITERVSSSSEKLNQNETTLLENAGNEMALLALEDPSLLPSLSLIRNLIDQTSSLDKDNRKKLLDGLIRALPSEDKKVGHDVIRVHPVNRAVLEAL